MKKINVKRLDNRGFTLIELLAVVVILAIVMGISATSVLNSINNSRKSTLHSAAQTAANNLNTWVSEDFLVNDNAKRKLGNDFVVYTQTTKANKWMCLTSTKPFIVNATGSNTVPLYSALGLSESDILLGNITASNNPSGGVHKALDKEPNCSMIRYNTTTASYEVLLRAKQSGKYYVSSDSTHYAYSVASEANVLPENYDDASYYNS